MSKNRMRNFFSLRFCFSRVIVAFTFFIFGAFLWAEGALAAVPNLPTGLTATCNGSWGNLTVSWDRMLGATKYDIRLDADPHSWDADGYWTSSNKCNNSASVEQHYPGTGDAGAGNDYCGNVADAGSGQKQSYNFGYKTGKFLFWVHAVNSEGGSHASTLNVDCGNLATSSSLGTVPTSSLSAVCNNNGTVTLSWGAATGATWYSFRAAKKNTWDPSICTSNLQDGTEYTSSGPGGKNYCQNYYTLRSKTINIGYDVPYDWWVEPHNSNVNGHSATGSFTCPPPNGGGGGGTAVNGTCGSAHGGTYSSAPTTGLCGAGTSSSVTTGTNNYTWSCSGSNGGSTASCSATRQTGGGGTAVNGTCGGAAKSYASTDTSFSGSMCGAGSGVTSPSSVAFPSAGSTVTWTCGGSNGGASSGNCTATRQSPPSFSVSATLSANPNPVGYGYTTRLTWTTSGALSCKLSGGQYGWNGTALSSCNANLMTGGLLSSTTYTLTAYSGPGFTGTSTSKSVTVSVNTPSVTKSVSLSVSPLSGAPGSSRTLSWSSSGVVGYNGGAPYCRVWEQDAASSATPPTLLTGGLLACDQTATSGTCSRSPASTKYYQAQCFDEDDGVEYYSAVVTAMVNASVVPNATATLTASPNPIPAGQNQTVLTWSSTNANYCSGGIGFSTGGATSGSVTVTQSLASHQWYVTCYDTVNDPGATKKAQAFVTVTKSIPINGACQPSPANLQTFLSTDTEWGTFKFCSAGTPNFSSPPSFPTPGNPVTWTCSGQNGGSDSQLCTAQRLSACTSDPTCGGTAATTCTTSTCTDSCGNSYPGTKSCGGKVGDWKEVAP